MSNFILETTQAMNVQGELKIPEGHGAIWWIADNHAEAQKWASELKQKGATIQKIEPHDDGKYDVVFSLDKGTANVTLGYAVEPDEWLDLDS